MRKITCARCKSQASVLRAPSPVQRLPLTRMQVVFASLPWAGHREEAAFSWQRKLRPREVRRLKVHMPGASATESTRNKTTGDLLHTVREKRLPHRDRSAALWRLCGLPRILCGRSAYGLAPMSRLTRIGDGRRRILRGSLACGLADFARFPCCRWTSNVPLLSAVKNAIN